MALILETDWEQSIGRSIYYWIKILKGLLRLKPWSGLFFPLFWQHPCWSAVHTNTSLTWDLKIMAVTLTPIIQTFKQKTPHEVTSSLRGNRFTVSCVLLWHFGAHPPPTAFCSLLAQTVVSKFAVLFGPLIIFLTEKTAGSNFIN